MDKSMNKYTPTEYQEESLAIMKIGLDFVYDALDRNVKTTKTEEICNDTTNS